MDYAFNNVVQGVRRMKVAGDVHCLVMTRFDHDWLVEKISRAHSNMHIESHIGVDLESFEGVPVRVFSKKEDMTRIISELRSGKLRFGMIYNHNTFIYSPHGDQR